MVTLLLHKQKVVHDHIIVIVADVRNLYYFCRRTDDEAIDMYMGVNRVDYFGNTALHIACRKDDAGIARMLLDMGTSQL